MTILNMPVHLSSFGTVKMFTPEEMRRITSPIRTVDGHKRQGKLSLQTQTSPFAKVMAISSKVSLDPPGRYRMFPQHRKMLKEVLETC
jgi:hypothetical protein